MIFPYVEKVLDKKGLETYEKHNLEGVSKDFYLFPYEQLIIFDKLAKSAIEVVIKFKCASNQSN